jgi:hypothetical protein
MFVTHRRFGTVVLAASGLIFIAAVADLITEPLPSGRSASIGRPAPRVRPHAVAANPAAGGRADPGVHLQIPGKIADSRSVRAPQATLPGPSAGAVGVRGPRARPAGRSADRGTVPGPQAALAGNTADGATVLGSPVALPGNTAEGGMVAGPQATPSGDTADDARGGAVPQPEATPTGSSADSNEDPGSKDRPRHRHHHTSRRKDRNGQGEHRGDRHSREEGGPGSADQGPTASPEPRTDADKQAPDEEPQSDVSSS